MDKFLSDFIIGYKVALIWSAPEDDDGNNLDEFSIHDFPPSTEAEIVEECTKFVTENRADLEEYESLIFTVRNGSNSSGDGGSAAEYAGHDFALTRNGHGVGFWDRGLDELGDRLSKACKTFGEYNLYVGDDNKLHGM